MQNLTSEQQMQQEMIATQIRELLRGRGVTFAGIDYTTTIKPRAAFKDRRILKRTVANVQIFATLKDMAVFERAVKKSAAKQEENDPAAVDAFKAQSNYFEHTDCFSIVRHKAASNLYLYAIFNGARSEYTIDGIPATDLDVADYLTPSDRAKILDHSGIVHNVTHGIDHSVHVRTIALHNVESIRAMGESLQF